MHWTDFERSELFIFYSGIIVPGGFGDRGIEGKILAAEWARKTKKPYLGENTLLQNYYAKETFVKKRAIFKFAFWALFIWPT